MAAFRREERNGYITLPHWYHHGYIPPTILGSPIQGNLDTPVIDSASQGHLGPSTRTVHAPSNVLRTLDGGMHLGIEPSPSPSSAMLRLQSLGWCIYSAKATRLLVVM